VRRLPEDRHRQLGDREGADQPEDHGRDPLLAEAGHDEAQDHQPEDELDRDLRAEGAGGREVAGLDHDDEQDAGDDRRA